MEPVSTKRCGLDIVGWLLHCFDGTVNLQCYTSDTETTLNCINIYLQCCPVKRQLILDGGGGGGLATAALTHTGRPKSGSQSEPNDSCDHQRAVAHNHKRRGGAGQVPCPRVQQQSGMGWDLNCQPFAHWMSRFTSKAIRINVDVPTHTFLKC